MVLITQDSVPGCVCDLKSKKSRPSAAMVIYSQLNSISVPIILSVNWFGYHFSEVMLV